MKEKVSDYIFRRLAPLTAGKCVFMLPGGGCMHLVDSLGRNPDLTYICNLHEQASAIAAEAAAQNTGKLGVALVTAGPGATNAITGIAGAWIDSTPVLVLSGQAKTTDLMHTHCHVRQMGIQEVDIASIVSPVTKYAVCITEASRVRYELEKALFLAFDGRPGPVWLDLPLDIQGAMIDPEKLPAFTPPEPVEDMAERAAQTILDALKTAKRPVIYAGNGVRLAGALSEFRQLADTFGVPILTSWKAADFIPEDHPFFAGRPGIIAQRDANFVQQTADVLIILGTRLDLCQTGFDHPHFAPRARRIMIDADPAEINKMETSMEGFTADAGKVIRALLASGKKFDFSPWMERCRAWRKQYPVILPEYRDETKERVNLYHLIDCLSDLLGENDLLIPGSSGMCAEVTMQAIRVRKGLRIHNTPGLGSMGFGLPAAIGACAVSGKHTTGIIGDGGLQHNIQELQTLSRLKLPLTLFILNNNGYGSIYNMQKGRFDGNFVACHPESGLTLPKLEKIANAYELTYTCIDSPRDLAGQLAKILAMPGPVICEVMLDTSVGSAPRLASETLPDGSIRSKPMEDLAPFLPPEILSAELAVE